MSELKHVQGLSELTDALRQFAPKLRRNVLGGATRDAAAFVRDAAREKAPEWTGPVSAGHPPPGTLKKEIIYKRIAEECTDQKEVFGVLVRRTKQTAFYWWWVEFGLPSRKIAAQPYLRPALSDNVETVIGVFRESITDRVGEALP